MNTLIDFSMMSLILLNLVLLGATRLIHSVRLVAVQGLILGLLPLWGMVGATHHLEIRLCAISLATLGVKCLLFPWLMQRIIREGPTHREVKPSIALPTALLTGIAALALAFWISHKLVLPDPRLAESLIIPAGFFGIFTGLLLIVTRRTALSQVIGYVALENGIFAIGLVFAHEAPLLIELGILLDVFVAVFVMGVTVFHINRDFDHMDTDRLTELRDLPP